MTSANDTYASNTAYNVSRNYSVNGLNQYITAGGASFAYDANGNLTSDGSRTFTYDIENRLVAAGGAPSAGLRYDPLGRLYEVVGASGTTRFLYDGDALVGEYNSAGAMTARYVHGSNAGADDPLVWYGGGTTRWLHADHQGSIVAITNGSGALSSINGYDEWGIPNATNVGRFQYTGQAWIPELGMYHYKARIYSPTLGRFLQTDPIGYDDQINLYAYVANDPINGTDPTGQATDTCGSRLGISASCSGETILGIIGNSSSRGPRRYAPDDQPGGGGSGRIDAEEVASNAADAASLRMRETRGRGRTAEEVTLQSLARHGYTVIGRQVYVRDTSGNLRIVDFVVRVGMGRLLGVEVKFGQNTRSVRQRAIDTNIRDLGGRIISRGQARLPHGMSVQYDTMEVHVILVRTP